MIKLYSERRIYRFLEVAVLLFVFAHILFFFGFTFWLFFTVIFASILTIMFCMYHCERLAVKENNRQKELHYQRLLLLRRLIDHSYTYKYDKALFYKKFCEEINIDKLKKHHLLNTGEIIRTQNITGTPLRARKLDKLSQDDYEFICLLNEGFTSRELSMIFGLSHPQSIYVKRHRIRTRLSGTAKATGGNHAGTDVEANVFSNKTMDLSNVVL